MGKFPAVFTISKIDNPSDLTPYLTIAAAAATYVPYTGAINNVTLGSYGLSSFGHNFSSNVYIGYDDTVGSAISVSTGGIPDIQADLVQSLFALKYGGKFSYQDFGGLLFQGIIGSATYAAQFSDGTAGHIAKLCDGTYSINLTGSGILTSNDQTPFMISGTNTSFYELGIKNLSGANGASTDFVSTADTGTASTKYIDMGINSSGGGISPFTTALEGYLYTSDDNLNIGAIASGKTIKFFAGNATTAIATISSTGLALNSALIVGYGGTSRGSFSTYGIICGGTSAQGALQQITQTSTVGAVLISGANAATLASFTTGLTYASSLLSVTGSVNATTNSTYQYKALYNASNYLTLTVGSTGIATFVTAGSVGDIILQPIGTASAISVLSDTGIMILGGTNGTNNESLTWDYETTANKVAVTTSTGVTDINFTGMSLSILSDTLGTVYGVGSDMSLFYDGTYGQLNTSLVAASDLRVTCGANKTLELQNVVYEDLQFPVSSAKVPAVNAPTWETFTTNTNEYSFTVNDYIDANAGEVPHKWVVGTAASPHLHVTPKDAQSTGSDRFAKFTIYFAYSDSTQAGTKVWTETSSTAELTIPTGTAALTGFYLDLPDFALTNYTVGTQIKVRIKRIAATGGTEYGSNVFITQCGIHFQENTIGSRNETSK